MSITSQCGHELPYNSRGKSISIKDYDRTNSPVINYLTVCPQCESIYRMLDKVLESENDETEWLEE